MHMTGHISHINIEDKSLASLLPYKCRKIRDESQIVEKPEIEWSKLNKLVVSPTFIAFLFWFSVSNSLITFYTSIVKRLVNEIYYFTNSEKYLHFEQKKVCGSNIISLTVKRWANWVVPGRGNRILEIFGSYLALTALFGQTAGIIIDLTTRWQLLRLTNEKKRLVGCSICTVLNVCFGLCVCILRNCFLDRKKWSSKNHEMFKFMCFSVSEDISKVFSVQYKTRNQQWPL